jgi:hypothetical protein
MRKAALVAVPVLALAAGCGHSDYAPYYVGTYAGIETVGITSNTTGQTSTGSYQIAFQIAQGSGGDDLVFIGTCGMTGHASSPNNFSTIQNTCTVHDATSGCDYTYNMQAGAGTKNGTAFAMSVPGTATIVCPSGSDSGTLNITWSMTQQ